MTARRAAQYLLVLGILCISLYWYPTDWPAAPLIQDMYPNVATSLISIALTVLLIDRLYEQRDSQQLRKRLIWEMGSTDRASAGRAVKELTDQGWLGDGKLVGVDLSLANLERVVLASANLSKVNLASSNLKYADLKLANLQEAILDDCTAEKANFKGAVLKGSSLRRAKLSEATMDDTDITSSTDMLGASLIRTSLRSARLTNARLEECDMLECDLSNADLSEALLLRANMDSSVLDGANLERADLEDLQNWESIKSIKRARVSGLRNAPNGFRDWALQNGAIE
jgi:uncharacterized protein YjbI with pentapeptide repeats